MTRTPQRVFFSCVTRQFKETRSELSKAAEGNGIRLTIQEDFESSASPYGTLVKIYEHLKEVDLVVQLIGAYPPAQVPSEMVEELYRHDPNLRNWLVRMALNEATGKFGYTDWEAYIALYLDRPFLPVHFQNGTRPEHTSRLERLGRHVESKIDSVGQIWPLIQLALGLVNRDERTARHKKYARDERRNVSYLIVFVVVVLSIAALLQLSIANQVGFAANQFLPTLGSVLACWAAFVLIQLGAMSDRLLISFRIRVALRTATALFFISVLMGFFIVAVGAEPNGYWPSLACGWLLLGFSVLRQTKEFEEEIDARKSNGRAGMPWSDHFYWTRRSEVLLAISQAGDRD